MPTLNPARAARLAASIDKAFGESFTFLPFTSTGDVNLSKIPDTSRAQFGARGSWDGPTKSDTPHARGSIQDDNAHSWTVSKPCACIAEAALQWLPKHGDRCRRELDGAIYEISTSAPDGFGNVYFFLTARQ